MLLENTTKIKIIFDASDSWCLLVKCLAQKSQVKQCKFGISLFIIARALYSLQILFSDLKVMMS